MRAALIVFVLLVTASLVLVCQAPPRPPPCRCAPPARRSVPVRELQRELEVLEARVDLLAARAMNDAELHAQATAYVLGKVQRDRERAARAFRVARRSP